MARAPVLSCSSQSLEARAQRCERERTVDDDHEHEGGGILGGPHYSAAKAGVLGLALAQAAMAAMQTKTNAFLNIIPGSCAVFSHRP